MPTHDRFDLSHWQAEFPLGRLREDAERFVRQRQRQLPAEYPDGEAVDDHVRLMSPKWEIVVGPKALAVNEQLRTEFAANRPYAGPRVATDVVVWARGEGAIRSATKVGGLPYRDASARWPADNAGTSRRFIGQLSFADSAEIIPGLPGDVLLIFGDDDALLSEPEQLAFEWVKLGITDLVREVPSGQEGLTPFYGVLHRTEDWADEARLPADARDIGLWEGTKLGGVPRFIQDDDVPGGRFIGALGSISVGADQPFPFVNQAEPRGWSRENDLMIGDMGSLYLFLQADGTVVGLPQCY